MNEINISNAYVSFQCPRYPRLSLPPEAFAEDAASLTQEGARVELIKTATDTIYKTTVPVIYSVTLKVLKSYVSPWLEQARISGILGAVSIKSDAKDLTTGTQNRFSFTRCALDTVDANINGGEPYATIKLQCSAQANTGVLAG